MTSALNYSDTAAPTAREPSAWAVGFEAFAGIAMVMIGAFHVVAGITALFNDEFFVIGREYTFAFDVTTWGWIHLAAGVVVLLSGLFIFTGNVLARTVGVGVALISAVANFMWLPYYQVWSILMIALSVAVIWALTVHGRDIAQ